jgi:tRNA dimethylallyltransferase
VEEAKRNTRHFARRQLTWFRHQLPEDTVWLDASRPRADIIEEIQRTWNDRR